MKTKLFPLIVIWLMISSATFAQKTAPVGLGLYSFRNQFSKDIPGTMAMVKQLGFRDVEVAGTYGKTPAEFRKILDEYKLKAISVGASFEDLDNNVPKVLAEAKALGAKYVACFWIPHAADNLTIYEADNAIDVLNTAGKLLADNGVNLCFHPHGYEFEPYENGTMLDYLVKNFDPKYVNLELDIYWVKAPGFDPVAILQKYPKRVTMIHLKDRKPGTPNTKNGKADVESNVTLGQGDVGIAAVMKQAKKSGVKYYFIEDESSRSVEQVPASLAYLESLK